MITLKEARKRAGLSQTRLCALAGVDQRLVSVLETGRQSTSRAFCAKVAPHLKVSADDLYSGQNIDRVLDAAAAVLKVIEEGQGTYPDELGATVEQLADLATKDKGKLGKIASGSLISIRNALKDQKNLEPSPDRDAFGRKKVSRGQDSVSRKSSKTYERDSFGRRHEIFGGK